MIRICTGNLVEHPSDALVNTVNTVGIMGKGIAAQFRRAYPAMFKAYEAACKRHEVELGVMHVWPTNQLSGPRFIINFPTKGHWKAKSRLADIESGLVDLVRVIDEYGIASIAVPPLGCGNGGLSWDAVRPRIEVALGPLPVDVCLFPPGATPEAAAMPDATPKRSLTPLRAALVRFFDRYGVHAMGASLIEAHKGMYFLEQVGEPLDLRFAKGQYGPYSNRLDHVVQGLEGHYLVGYGDGSARVTDLEPMRVVPGAAAEADALLAQHPSMEKHLELMLELVAGFETAYFMELLATLHWIGTHDDPRAMSDVSLAGDLVRAWSARKRGLFGQAHVHACWNRLWEYGWLRLDASGSVGSERNDASLADRCDAVTQAIASARLEDAPLDAEFHAVATEFIAGRRTIDELVAFAHGYAQPVDL